MEMRIFLKVLLCFNGFILFTSEKCKRYRFCECNALYKRLTCYRLNYIPKPQDFIEELVLHDNFFPHLDLSTFSNISSIKIKKLELRSNSIQTIQSGVFSVLPHLVQLEISGEDKLNNTELKHSFKGISIKQLRKLWLEGNSWIHLQSELFEYFNGAELELISLKDNKLIDFDFDLLQPLKKLHKLDCSNNEIITVNIRIIPALGHLNFSGNNIVFVPDFCHSNENISQKIITLVLTDNAIREMSDASFNCLKNLQKLYLDGNRIKTLNNNVFASLPSLKKLSLSRIMQLETIKFRAFNFSSLDKLVFARNRFRFDKSGKYDPMSVFRYSKNLKELDLTQNYLPCKKIKKLVMIFSPLTQLEKLVLHGTSLCTIPDELLRKLPHLISLNVMGNKIESWNESLFRNVTSLKILNMEGNLIHTINETSFPPEMLKSLDELSLGDNPFWCTCDQKWLLDTLRSTNLKNKMKMWPSRFTCYYPQNLMFSLLANYYPTYTECNMLYIITIAISTGVGLLLVLMVFILRCQINIRNFLYFIRVYRLRKSGYLKLESSDEFEYDAFIVYCDADRQWVHASLLRELENSGLKVCIHHRDFDVGEHIIDNIEKYMDKSWKVIVVMSNKLAESEWCQWEIELISERRRRLGKNALVLIMYRQIDSHHMTSHLRSLMSTTPYLTFVDGFGEKLFWNTVRNCVRKRLTYPPTAVL